jgi:hypothetical protein
MVSRWRYLERAAVKQDVLESILCIGALLADVEPDVRLHEKSSRTIKVRSEWVRGSFYGAKFVARTGVETQQQGGWFDSDEREGGQGDVGAGDGVGWAYRGFGERRGGGGVEARRRRRRASPWSCLHPCGGAVRRGQSSDSFLCCGFSLEIRAVSGRATISSNFDMRRSFRITKMKKTSHCF